MSQRGVLGPKELPMLGGLPKSCNASRYAFDRVRSNCSTIVPPSLFRTAVWIS